MKRLTYRVYRLISALRYGAGRRFTPAGWLVVTGMIATAAIGSDTEQAMAYQTFTLLLCLLVAALISTPFFRARFSVRRALPRFGSVDEPVRYRIHLRNDTAQTQAGLTILESLNDARPSYAEFLESIQRTRDYRSFRLAKLKPKKSIVLLKGKVAFRYYAEDISVPNPKKRVALSKELALPALPPHGEIEVTMELTPQRRGLLRFSGVTVARPDPFGLIRALLEIPCPQSLLVLPKRHWLPPLALPGALQYQPGGVALASAVGQSDEFVALRDYRRGDPLRHVHWKSWARTGRPIVKEFQDEFFVRHALILDTFAAPDADELFEEAVSVAASFACALQSQESLLDLLFVGTEAFCFTVGRGLAHADQMLEILAAVRACREPRFRELRQLVIGHSGAVSGCVCVFLAWDEERQQLVRQLQAAGRPLLVLVVTPAGETAPLDPGPMREEPQRFRQLESGRVAEGLAALT